jgi:hypothetical protein
MDAYKDNLHSDDYYINLIKIVQIDANTIAIKPGKASSLLGKHFELCTYDGDGNSYSKVELEVTANGT